MASQAPSDMRADVAIGDIESCDVRVSLNGPAEDAEAEDAEDQIYVQFLDECPKEEVQDDYERLPSPDSVSTTFRSASRLPAPLRHDLSTQPECEYEAPHSNHLDFHVKRISTAVLQQSFMDQLSGDLVDIASKRDTTYDCIIPSSQLNPIFSTPFMPESASSSPLLPPPGASAWFGDSASDDMHESVYASIRGSQWSPTSRSRLNTPTFRMKNPCLSERDSFQSIYWAIDSSISSDPFACSPPIPLTNSAFFPQTMRFCSHSSREESLYCTIPLRPRDLLPGENHLENNVSSEQDSKNNVVNKSDTLTKKSNHQRSSCHDTPSSSVRDLTLNRPSASVDFGETVYKDDTFGSQGFSGEQRCDVRDITDSQNLSFTPKGNRQFNHKNVNTSLCKATDQQDIFTRKSRKRPCLIVLGVSINIVVVATIVAVMLYVERGFPSSAPNNNKVKLKNLPLLGGGRYSFSGNMTKGDAELLCQKMGAQLESTSGLEEGQFKQDIYFFQDSVGGNYSMYVCSSPPVTSVRNRTRELESEQDESLNTKFSKT